MLRIALIAACLAGSVGCSSARKVTNSPLAPGETRDYELVEGKPTGTPKQYDDKDLGAGPSASSRR